jgi:hypothetical protein
MERDARVVHVEDGPLRAALRTQRHDDELVVGQHGAEPVEDPLPRDALLAGEVHLAAPDLRILRVEDDRLPRDVADLLDQVR